MKNKQAPDSGDLLSAGIRERLLQPGDRILVAVSGGADSVALLASLRERSVELQLVLIAAHLNHGLRGDESERDEGFVRSLCAEWGISLESGRADIASRSASLGKGLEAAAREGRYAFLEEAAQKHACNKIATAHTADDNAETLLLNLTRGTGLRGLCGIPLVRGKIIRPMLDTTRAEVERFLEQRKIAYVTDSTNSDLRFTRNKIRQTVLPTLKEMNPNLLGQLRGMSELLTEDANTLDAAADLQMQELDGLSVSIETLRQMPGAVSSRIIRKMSQNAGASELTREQIQKVLHLAKGGNPSAQVHLPAGILAKRRYGDIIFDKVRTENPFIAVEHSPGVWDFGGWTVRIERVDQLTRTPEPNKVYLRTELMDEAFEIRARRSGDTLSPTHRGWTKSLKKIYIDWKIPREERSLRPVLAYNGEVCAIPGLPPDRKYAAEAPPAIKITFLEAGNHK